ncbi:type II toxin-antitoxin system RelE/ParE family toxin [Ekhidna sp.]|uniref:type II toxin-antitoxin system RelE/ParE family toxin n=1 Tax=Ekhidna sp. TaxID=2608089 RepID=UPI003512260F
MIKYKVEVTEAFTSKLLIIIDQIKQDRPNVARKIRKEILLKIKSLQEMPLRNRQSVYFNNENIRDLIHKGFTIVYEIQERKVVVFSILKHQLEP